MIVGSAQYRFTQNRSRLLQEVREGKRTVPRLTADTDFGQLSESDLEMVRAHIYHREGEERTDEGLEIIVS